MYLNQYIIEISKDWIEEIDSEGQIVFHRIYFFWNRVLQAKTYTGNFQFKSLGKVVRSALCLAHGNAEVESSLSENKRTVTSDRTLLSESSLNGLRMIKDIVNTQDEGKVHMIPISNELKQAGQHVYQAYNERLRDEREEKEKAQRQKERERKEAEKLEEEIKQLEEAEKNLKDRKRILDDKEKDLTKEEKELSEELKTAEKLYKEANERLSKSIKNKNFEDASVVQALYEAAQKRIQDSNERLQKCLKGRDEISSEEKSNG